MKKIMFQDLMGREMEFEDFATVKLQGDGDEYGIRRELALYQQSNDNHQEAFIRFLEIMRRKKQLTDAEAYFIITGEEKR